MQWISSGKTNIKSIAFVLKVQKVIQNMAHLPRAFFLSFSLNVFY